MKCAGISSPLESLTKPESIGCWISACTSVMSPLLVARTRMVDAMGLLLYLWRLSAAAADGDFDFLVGLEQLAAGLDQHGHLAGLRHLDAVGDGRHGACRYLVGGDQH